MEIFRTKTKVTNNGSLIIKGLPFNKGEKVEVIVQRFQNSDSPQDKCPLQGSLLKYEQPFSGVDEDHWDALK